jgi:hypothetical protein
MAAASKLYIAYCLGALTAIVALRYFNIAAGHNAGPSLNGNGDKEHVAAPPAEQLV